MDTVFLPGMPPETVDPVISHEIMTKNILSFLEYIQNEEKEINWFGNKDYATVVDRNHYPNGFNPSQK